MAPLENAADVEKIFSDVDSSGSILPTLLLIWRDPGSPRINQALTMFRQAFIANAVGGTESDDR